MKDAQECVAHLTLAMALRIHESDETAYETTNQPTKIPSLYGDCPVRTSRLSQEGTGSLFQPGEISFQNVIRIRVPVTALEDAKKSHVRH